MSETIIPVILCGGSGTRLWPLSRASYPKQFSRILGETSLFQASVERFPEPEFAAPIVVTNAEFRFIATEQLGGIGRLPGAVLIEPEGRNTAPAVLAAALQAARDRARGLPARLPVRSRHRRRRRLPGGGARRPRGGGGGRARHLRHRPEPGGDRLRLARARRRPGHGRPPCPAAARALRGEARRRHRRGDARRTAVTSGTAASSSSRSRRSSRPSPPISRRCWRRCAGRSRAPAPTSPSSGSSRRPSRRRRRSRSTTR